jgi:hypothetical protein
MRIATIAAAILISFLAADLASAQQPASPAPAAEASKKTRKPRSERSPQSLACSAEADQKALKGAERRKFRRACMKGAAKSG